MVAIDVFENVSLVGQKVSSRKQEVTFVWFSFSKIKDSRASRSDLLYLSSRLVRLRWSDELEFDQLCSVRSR